MDDSDNTQQSITRRQLVATALASGGAGIGAGLWAGRQTPPRQSTRNIPPDLLVDFETAFPDPKRAVPGAGEMVLYEFLGKSVWKDKYQSIVAHLDARLAEVTKDSAALGAPREEQYRQALIRQEVFRAFTTDIYRMRPKGREALVGWLADHMRPVDVALPISGELLRMAEGNKAGAMAPVSISFKKLPVTPEDQNNREVTLIAAAQAGCKSPVANLYTMRDSGREKSVVDYSDRRRHHPRAEAEDFNQLKVSNPAAGLVAAAIEQFHQRHLQPGAPFAGR